MKLRADISSKDVEDAFDNSEDEIFAHGLGVKETDDDGDRSPEEMKDSLEGNVVDEESDPDETDDEADTGDDKDKAGKTETKTDDASKDDDKSKDDDEEEPRRGDPKLALRDERERRRAAERDRDERIPKEDFNRLLSRLEVLERERSAPKADDDKSTLPEEPDIFADPDGFKQSIKAELKREHTLQRVEETFADAHEAHGKEFEAAYGALTALDRANPTDRALVQRISTSPNPGKALMKWHRSEAAVREIGDPAAFKERVRKELRDELLEELREEAEGNPEPGERRTRRNPPSLNSGARGSSGRGRAADPGLYDDSEESVFDHATR